MPRARLKEQAKRAHQVEDRMVRVPERDKMARRRERHVTRSLLRRCIEFDESHWPSVVSTE